MKQEGPDCSGPFTWLARAVSNLRGTGRGLIAYEPPLEALRRAFSARPPNGRRSETTLFVHSRWQKQNSPDCSGPFFGWRGRSRTADPHRVKVVLYR